jgi:catechol 2,3-dioxygenase-like lactoylglutathione lyase family enzyme
MPVHSINHFLIRAADIERSKNFYVDVLGFEVAQRPDFPFPGYWLGTNGSIQVHIAQDGIENRSFYYLGTRDDAANGQTGVIDHVAFLCEDPGEFKQRLDQKGVSYRTRFLPDNQLFQLFLTDPDGVMIELNFFGVQDVAAFGGEDYTRMTRVN